MAVVLVRAGFGRRAALLHPFCSRSEQRLWAIVYVMNRNARQHFLLGDDAVTARTITIARSGSMNSLFNLPMSTADAHVAMACTLEVQ
jgi:hypothetical protein